MNPEATDQLKRDRTGCPRPKSYLNHSVLAPLRFKPSGRSNRQDAKTQAVLVPAVQKTSKDACPTLPQAVLVPAVQKTSKDACPTLPQAPGRSAPLSQNILKVTLIILALFSSSEAFSQTKGLTIEAEPGTEVFLGDDRIGQVDESSTFRIPVLPAGTEKIRLKQGAEPDGESGAATAVQKTRERIAEATAVADSRASESLFEGVLLGLILAAAGFSIYRLARSKRSRFQVPPAQPFAPATGPRFESEFSMFGGNERESFTSFARDLKEDELVEDLNDQFGSNLDLKPVIDLKLEEDNPTTGSETTDKVSPDLSSNKRAIEHSEETEQPHVFQSPEKPEVEASHEGTEIEASPEDPEFVASQEETEVETSQEEPEIKVSPVEPQIEASQEEPEASGLFAADDLSPEHSSEELSTVDTSEDLEQKDTDRYNLEPRTHTEQTTEQARELRTSEASVAATLKTSVEFSEELSAAETSADSEQRSAAPSDLPGEAITEQTTEQARELRTREASVAATLKTSLEVPEELSTAETSEDSGQKYADPVDLLVEAFTERVVEQGSRWSPSGERVDVAVNPGRDVGSEGIGLSAQLTEVPTNGARPWDAKARAREQAKRDAVLAELTREFFGQLNEQHSSSEAVSIEVTQNARSFGDEFVRRWLEDPTPTNGENTANPSIPSKYDQLLYPPASP